MRQTIPFLLAAVALAALPAVAEDREAQEERPPAQPSQPADGPKVGMNELETKFEKMMSGATLVGRATTQKRGEAETPPAEDRYVISKVTKIGEDLWLFTARVGRAKLPIPIPVPVKWAGDTPIISVTKVSVPGMGTFTARVLIYDDHYAGTWDAGDHGGHLWGRIERAGGDKGDPKTPDAAKTTE